MRFKWKEGTQRTSLRVILSLNLIVPVDEIGTVEPMGRLTFEINDDEVCVKNCESNWMLSVAPLSKIHGFVLKPCTRFLSNSLLMSSLLDKIFYLGDKNGEAFWHQKVELV